MVVVSVRLQHLFYIYILFTCCLLTSVAASPFQLVIFTAPQRSLFPRGSFVLNNATGTPRIFSPDDGKVIPQGSGTDGGGNKFSLSAILWIGFCLAIGTPMAAAGIRGRRMTTGVGIGLSAAVCSWAAFINTVNDVGIPDAILTAFVFGSFFLGFILGVFEFARVAGVATLSITGGLAFGIRIVLVKEGLLISDSSIFFLNWLVIALFGALGGAATVSQATRRASIAFGSASVGTFLFFLGIDLIVKKQSGISRGLRFLFDRNLFHALDIVVGGYHPPLLTQVLLGVSLALTPILAYLQHRIFKQPFLRNERPDSPVSYSPTVGPTIGPSQKSISRPAAFFADLWDEAKMRSSRRFSL